MYDEWNYDGEIKRMLNWDDMYMRGVALRYRALRNMERQQPMGRILLDLKNSEKYLKRAGAEIELARTRTALGNSYLKKGEQKLAQSHLEKHGRSFRRSTKAFFRKTCWSLCPRNSRSRS